MFLFRVCDALSAAGVPYAIAGGYAVALHGAVRGTVDVDLVVRLEEAAFGKAEQALKGLGLQPRLPVTATEVFQFREEYIRNRNLLAWSFVNPSNPDCKVVKLSVKGRTLKVVSRADLIRMKARSARPQDLEDIAALKRLEER
jgi:hypothetical protein